MNTVNRSGDQVLDHALIQCLRLFAKHGRKVRCQDLPPPSAFDSTYVEKESEEAREQEIVQK